MVCQVGYSIRAFMLREGWRDRVDIPILVSVPYAEELISDGITPLQGLLHRDQLLNAIDQAVHQLEVRPQTVDIADEKLPLRQRPAGIASRATVAARAVSIARSSAAQRVHILLHTMQRSRHAPCQCVGEALEVQVRNELIKFIHLAEHLELDDDRGAQRGPDILRVRRYVAEPSGINHIVTAASAASAQPWRQHGSTTYMNPCVCACACACVWSHRSFRMKSRPWPLIADSTAAWTSQKRRKTFCRSEPFCDAITRMWSLSFTQTTKSFATVWKTPLASGLPSTHAHHHHHHHTARTRGVMH
jgi:hypothetical protein